MGAVAGVYERETLAEKSVRGGGMLGVAVGRSLNCNSFGQVMAQKRIVRRALGAVPMAWMRTSSRTDVSIVHALPQNLRKQS